WSRICEYLSRLESKLPSSFFNDLVSSEEAESERKQGVREQKVEDGITSQMRVMEIPAATWKKFLEEGQRRKLLTEIEIGCLSVAQPIPKKLPSPKQCVVILSAYEKLLAEGIQFAS